MTAGRLLQRKIRRGTANLAVEPAMSREECERAILTGVEVVKDLEKKGVRVLETEEDLPWSLDGEFAPSEPVVEIRNLQKRLEIMVPRKHIGELMHAVKDGWEACILFVVQMEGMKVFEPNEATDPEFASVLREAYRAGVGVLAHGCKVTRDSMALDHEIPIRL